MAKDKFKQVTKYIETAKNLNKTAEKTDNFIIVWWVTLQLRLFKHFYNLVLCFITLIDCHIITLYEYLLFIIFILKISDYSQSITRILGH